MPRALSPCWSLRLPTRLRVIDGGRTYSPGEVYGAHGYQCGTRQESNEDSKLTFSLTSKIGYGREYKSAYHKVCCQ